MTDQFELPATVQPQMWVNNNAVDSDDLIHFDAHDALLRLDARTFQRTVAELLKWNSHDYDELAINSGIVDDWLKSSENATILVSVDENAFSEWLEKVGLTEDEARNMTEEGLSELRNRLAEAPSFSA